MPEQNTVRDSEIGALTRRNPITARNRPAWWRRATAYGLNRLADVISGQRRTPKGTGRALLRDRRRLNLARAT